MQIISSLYAWLRPTLAAIFVRDLPFNIWWRLLLFQPFLALSYGLCKAPYVFSRPFTVEHLPIAPSRSSRVLVFQAPGSE